MNNIMMKIMSLALPTCKDVSKLTSQVMDETLPFGKRLAMKIHLSMCVFCRRNAKQFHLMRKLAAKETALKNNTYILSNNASERIAESLRQQDNQS